MRRQATAIRAERNYPIRGIREDLPEGERVLWQGAPDWRDLAVTAFHIRQVAWYFAALLVLRVAFEFGEGAGVAKALASAAPLLVWALLGLALLAALALWSAKTTIYAITTRRVVMRVGMALPLDVNLVFTGIASAQLTLRPSGTGDIPFALQPGAHLAYAHLWPYARPWRLSHPQPMMRAVPQAEQVATLLAQSLAATGGTAHAPAAQAGTGPAVSASPLLAT